VPVAPGHRRYLRQLAFTPDGRTLITLSSESAPRFWDLAALADRTTVGSAIYTNAAMALSPDGQTVAACSRDSKSVQLWDVTSAQSKGTFAKGHGDRIEVMAFAPDGTTLASGGRDKLVRLWEVNGGLEKKAIACDNNPTVLLFTPDGQTLVIGGPDIKHITLWDVTGGKERQDIKNIEYGMVYAALAPDGKTLAFVGKDNQVRLWDLSNSKEKSPPPVRHPAPIRALLFSLDGRTLIASAWDGQILFWKVSDRVLTRTIQLPGPVTSLALALDNRHLAAGTAASMVYLLRLGPVPSGE
jgi:dipeptidyl aminopeptidase/acylaminoacyl peptidase